MAKNMVFKYDERKTRARAVPSGTLGGVPLLINTRPAVTLTARGDAVETLTNIGGSGYNVTRPIGQSSSNLPGEATVAFDGTWEFTGITGVTTSTGQDVAIYITGAGALTTTATSNTLYGYTDYPRDYNKATGRAPVRIGA